MEIDYKQWATAEEWLTTTQLAALTKTSRSFWDKARVRGDGPPWTAFGNRPRYRRADIEAWIIARTIRSTSQRWRV
jgi:hypothetical protein